MSVERTPLDDQIGRTIQEIYDENKRLRAALDVAVSGLRELEDLWSQAKQAADSDHEFDPLVYRDIVADLTKLLDRIGATS